MTTTNRKILSFEQSDVTIPRARRRPSYNAVVAIAMAKEAAAAALCWHGNGEGGTMEKRWRSDGAAADSQYGV